MSEQEAIRIKRSYISGCEPSHLPQLQQETGRRRYDRVVDLLEESRPNTVLDLGCGEGNLERLLTIHGMDFELLVAADINRAHVLGVRQMAVQRPGKQLEVVQLDAENLPFQPKCFDVIVATEVIEHVPDESKCLRELARLRPEKLIITVPALRHPQFLLILGSERLDVWLRKVSTRLSDRSRNLLYWFKILKGFLFPVFLISGILKARRLPYHDYRFYHGNVPHRLYTSSYMVRELASSGFRVEHVGGVGFAPPLVQELETAFDSAGLRGPARVLAFLQALFDERFSRKPDTSQNVVIVCSGNA